MKKGSGSEELSTMLNPEECSNPNSYSFSEGRGSDTLTVAIRVPLGVLSGITQCRSKDIISGPLSIIKY